MFIAYVIAECVGSYLGYLVLSLVTPHEMFFEGHGPGFCLTQIHPDVSLGQVRTNPNIPFRIINQSIILLFRLSSSSLLSLLYLY